MSLLDFAKNIGRNLFSSPEDAAAKIKQHIEEDNPGVHNLDVVFQDGVVTLRGTADSWEAADKALLMAGNVQGVGKVASELAVTPADGGAAAPQGSTAAPPGAVEYYTIQAGDTLTAIAKRFYGDASQYPRLFEANREVIKDPDKIFVGQTIRIPKA
ncbi:peptidoglycan-binding protein LysM [Candidatus Methylocalor cossyra]|uniref:Peptidoglycan-binding protein LysM n=1 Tax=Candidatus Methylocalor cossyra TaxID=3108543 RepID=A0ABM9NEX6_9GAMM